MKIAYFVALTFFFNFIHVDAQELNCKVEVNASQIEGTSESVFKTLEQSISDYLNTTSFTNNNFGPEEKIECRLMLELSDVSHDRFSGRLLIQSSRPIYNSDYTTTLLNFIDNNVGFTYREFQPLEFSQIGSSDELTSLLDFYAFIILALDYDSFSPHGGEEYYRKARAIVLQHQNSQEKGWEMWQDNRNRTAFLSAYFDAPTNGYRDLLYQYHRNGLDNMAGSSQKSRSIILDIVINHLENLYNADPFSAGIINFRDTKLEELLSMFSNANATDKEKLRKTLLNLFPDSQSRISAVLR